MQQLNGVKTLQIYWYQPFNLSITQKNIPFVSHIHTFVDVKIQPVHHHWCKWKMPACNITTPAAMYFLKPLMSVYNNVCQILIPHSYLFKELTKIIKTNWHRALKLITILMCTMTANLTINVECTEQYVVQEVWITITACWIWPVIKTILHCNVKYIKMCHTAKHTSTSCFLWACSFCRYGLFSLYRLVLHPDLRPTNT
jgi:hypothetical protein